MVILLLLSGGLGRGSGREVGLELLELVLVFEDLLEQPLELVVEVHAVPQVAEPGPRLEQLAERLDLLRHPARLEVVHRLEPQLHRELGAVAGQRVLHPERQARRHLLHDLVEAVAVDLDELAVLHRRQRPRHDVAHLGRHVLPFAALLHRLPLHLLHVLRRQLLQRVGREVAHHAEDERQLLHHHRAVGVHLVGDVDPRRADPPELVMDSSRHRCLRLELRSADPAVI